MSDNEAKRKRMFVDIHVIQTVPPSCINRDDTGSPKTAMYGGVRRARVSSQSWKRSMRITFSDSFDEMMLGQRTKDIVGLISEHIDEDPEIDKAKIEGAIREVINLASAKDSKPIIPDISYGGIKKALKNAVAEDADSEEELVDELKMVISDLVPETDTSKSLDALFKSIDKKLKGISDNKKDESYKTFELEILNLIKSSSLLSKSIGAELDALFFIGRQEAVNIANLVKDYCKDDTRVPKKEQVQEALNFNTNKNGVRSHAIDVALFGRMVAKSPTLNVDAAAQVAHAISTHKIENEFDYFTAMDDRQREDNAGAGMIGTAEFNSSTLYRYATVAVHELIWQLAYDPIATGKAAREFVRAFIISMPNGKQNAYANLTAPNSVLISIRGDQPVNLVTAFESPVRPELGIGGYARESSKRLAEYAKEVCSTFVSAPIRTWQIGTGLEFIGPSVEIKTALDELEKYVGETYDVS